MNTKQTVDALRKLAAGTQWPELHEAVTQLEMLAHINGELVKALDEALHQMRNANADADLCRRVGAALDKARKTME